MSLAIIETDATAHWVKLLNNRFKIEVALERQAAFQTALASYAVELGESIESLYELASRRQLPQEIWQRVVHIATNHETRFFRNPSVISCVATFASEFTRPRILSVGCSTGEEAYSLAIECSRKQLPNFQIHGTDISQPCIETARLGVYRSTSEIEDRYAAQRANGQIQIRSWLKELVSFEEHNVLSTRPHSFYTPNIILTQHMLIYYRVSTRHKILESLACQLPSGGYLIVAAAEEAGWEPQGFDRLRNLPATVFRKH